MLPAMGRSGELVLSEVSCGMGRACSSVRGPVPPLWPARAGVRSGEPHPLCGAQGAVFANLPHPSGCMLPQTADLLIVAIARKQRDSKLGLPRPGNDFPSERQFTDERLLWILGIFWRHDPRDVLGAINSLPLLGMFLMYEICACLGLFKLCGVYRDLYLKWFFRLFRIADPAELGVLLQQLDSPVTWVVFSHSEIPIVALMTTFFLGRQLTSIQWVSVVLLVDGTMPKLVQFCGFPSVPVCICWYVSFTHTAIVMHFGGGASWCLLDHLRWFLIKIISLVCRVFSLQNCRRG